MKQVVGHVSTSLERMGRISASQSQTMGSCKGRFFPRKMRKGTTHGPNQPIVPLPRVREVGSNGWATGPGLSCGEAEASGRQESGPKPRGRGSPAGARALRAAGPAAKLAASGFSPAGRARQPGTRFGQSVCFLGQGFHSTALFPGRGAVTACASSAGQT